MCSLYKLSQPARAITLIF